MKITRGISRKINLGNYESADFWSTYEDEVDEKSTQSMSELSAMLYSFAKDDVEKAIKNFKEELAEKVIEVEQQASKERMKKSPF